MAAGRASEAVEPGKVESAAIQDGEARASAAAGRAGGHLDGDPDGAVLLSIDSVSVQSTFTHGQHTEPP
jgi:hypothetical protein